MLKPNREVGIVGYGAYVPRYRLAGEEIARVWRGRDAGWPIKQKAVPGIDEDTVTMSIEAARNALLRADIDPQDLKALWVGSESHPYAVKPTSTIVAETLGALPETQAADWEFSGKAGTEALQACIGLVGSGMADYAMCIGMDAAQGRPGDALEYTASAGGAALIIGPAAESIAVIEGSLSYVSNSMDVWRRPGTRYYSNTLRSTGVDAYYDHVKTTAATFLAELGRTAADYQHVVLHQPDGKLPRRVADSLGFTWDQLAAGFFVEDIGSTHAGSVLLGLSGVLDAAQPGDRVLVVSYGSGAGSDAFSFVVTGLVTERRLAAPVTRDYVMRRKNIDYATYARFQGNFRSN